MHLCGFCALICGQHVNAAKVDSAEEMHKSLGQRLVFELNIATKHLMPESVKPGQEKKMKLMMKDLESSVPQLGKGKAIKHGETAKDTMAFFGSHTGQLFRTRDRISIDPTLRSHVETINLWLQCMGAQ